jgi:acetolactate synthase-1/2/3 large subunit
VPAELYLLAQDHDPAPAGATLHDLHARVPANADSATVAAVADMLANANQPLLHVGLGAADCGEGLVDLAEKLGAVVSSTFSGKGAFPESHPQWLWPGFGSAAPAHLRSIASRCDAALVLGARLGEVSTASFGVALPEASAHVDLDPAVPGANFPVRFKIVADCAAFVEALNTALYQRQRRDVLKLTSELTAARHRVALEQDAPGLDGRVGPASLFRTLQRTLGSNVVFTSDSGNGTFLAVEHLRLDRPRRLLSPTDYSCMGYALPAAVGAAIANPGTPALALCGDGALLMTGLELTTAAQRGLPVGAVVLRDGKLGQTASFQRTLTNAAPCSVLPDYDLTALAAVAGCACRKVAREAETGLAIQWLREELAAGRPAVLDVAIDYSRKTYFTRGVVKANFGRLSWQERVRMVKVALERRLRLG